MTARQRYSHTTYMVLCGLFAALTAICSFITIPLGFTPIPVNLGTLGVFLTGGILGKKYGVISLVVYVLLGAAGIPVFAGFRAGPSVLVGPTGGYVAGYIAAAFLIGLILDKGSRKPIGSNREQDASEAFVASRQTSRTASQHSSRKIQTLREMALCILAMVIGLAACYALGTLWFLYSTGTDLWAAMTACVFPFLPGDAIKILAAAMMVGKLRPLLR